MDIDPAKIAAQIKAGALEIAAFINWLKTKREFLKSVKKTSKHYLSQGHIDIERIPPDFFDHRLGIGQVITTTGYLSKYLLRHRPDFYTTHGIQNTKLQYTRQDNDLIFDSHSDIVPMQLPIETIPPIIEENQTHYVYCLYSADLSSFVLDIDIAKAKNRNKDNVLDIQRMHSPILVISNKPLINEAEAVVKITGIITQFDSTMEARFAQQLSSTQQEIFKNTISVFNEERSSLCLDIRDNPSLVTVKSRKASLRCTLYVETHFENTAGISKFDNKVDDCMPGANRDEFRWVIDPSGIGYKLHDSDIIVAKKDKSANYAFYLGTDLLDRDVYKKDLERLYSYIKVLHKNVQTRFRREESREITLAIDFLYDYSKAKLFHSNGPLVSKTVEQILRTQPDLKTTVEEIRMASKAVKR